MPAGRQVLNPKSNIALGHTRWATHGGATVANAHPHLDCTGKLAIVHNGIVENYQQIKSALLKKGHKFISETDTEVVVHLVEDLAKEGDLKGAVLKAFLKVKGLNAFVFLSSEGKILALKNGTPLVIGLSGDGNFIASDASAISAHTDKVIFVEDGELVEVAGDKVVVYDAKSGKQKSPAIAKLEETQTDSVLGKYKHFLIKEIYDQPDVLRRIAANGGQIEDLAQTIKDSKGTFFIGCGSASYAALAGTYLFSSVSNLHVNFAIGSEFDYLEDYLNKNSLVIAISQSGETIDVIQPVMRAKKRGAKIVALVNVAGSALWRNAHFKILLGAGQERAVCATKSITAMFANLIFLSYAMAGKIEEGRKIINQSAKAVDDALSPQNVKRVKELSSKLKKVDDIYIIGRGLSYSAALEAALKLKEVSYIHSEGFAGGELKHGVIALIEKGTPCIVFAPNDKTYDDIISNAIEIKARGGYIIGISHKNNEVFDYFLPVGDCKEGSLIAGCIPIQLLTYFIALERGLDPDKPRNLAKSVTVK